MHQFCERDSRQMRAQSIFSLVGHGAHDLLHLATDPTMLPRSAFINGDDGPRLHCIVDIAEGNRLASPGQTSAAALAGESFHQTGATQREQEAPDYHGIRVHAPRERPRIHDLTGERERRHDMNRESELLIDHDLQL